MKGWTKRTCAFILALISLCLPALALAEEPAPSVSGAVEAAAGSLPASTAPASGLPTDTTAASTTQPAPLSSSLVVTGYQVLSGGRPASSIRKGDKVTLVVSLMNTGITTQQAGDVSQLDVSRLVDSFSTGGAPQVQILSGHKGRPVKRIFRPREQQRSRLPQLCKLQSFILQRLMERRHLFLVHIREPHFRRMAMQRLEDSFQITFQVLGIQIFFLYIKFLKHLFQPVAGMRRDPQCPRPAAITGSIDLPRLYQDPAGVFIHLSPGFRHFHASGLSDQKFGLQLCLQ